MCGIVCKVTASFSMCMVICVCVCVFVSNYYKNMPIEDIPQRTAAVGKYPSSAIVFSVTVRCCHDALFLIHTDRTFFCWIQAKNTEISIFNNSNFIKLKEMNKQTSI